MVKSLNGIFSQHGALPLSSLSMAEISSGVHEEDSSVVL